MLAVALLVSGLQDTQASRKTVACQDPSDGASFGHSDFSHLSAFSPAMPFLVTIVCQHSGNTPLIN